MGGGGATEITRALPMVNARYVKAKTCVWWDIENCGVPRSCDPYSIAQNISKSLADMNYKGAVTISAYGDTTQINSSVQQALSSTGIALNHVPAGIKDASDKKILVDMLIWGYDNPPPANHLLISGDRDFSNALHQLSMRKYNILLAQPEKASQALVSAAKTVWLWTSLVVGGRPFEKLPNFHNTSTNRKSSIVTESNRILYSSQPDDFNLKNNNNGNFYNGNNAKQISKTPSHPVLSSSSSNGIEDGNKQSIGSSDSSKSNQENDLKHPNHLFVSTTADMASNCITSITNPTPVIPKSKNLVDSGQFNAQCLPTSNYTPKIEQKYGNKLPRNTAMSTVDGSGVKESIIKDTTKINNGSTLSQPSPLVVPESSKPLCIGSTFANIQPLPDMASSNNENEMTQPSHAPEAKDSRNINDTSSSFSTKPSSQVLPESNSPNVPKINANSKVKPVIKGNRNYFHKQQQNKCARSYFQSRNFSGANYNHSSSSSPASSNCLRGQMGFILEALNILKSEKIPPTKANLSDCFRYGNIGAQNFNVQSALDYAVEHQVVVMHKSVGNCMDLYVGRNDTLWNYVNFMDSKANHDTEKFDAVLNFLSSANGCSAILSSQCRYEAALVLKQYCLKNIVLGEILQLLHIIIQFRKWIIPHDSGWQPLAVTVLMNPNEGSTSSPSTSFGWE